jgi:predicted DNA-binding transcriptional regulator YafY
MKSYGVPMRAARLLELLLRLQSQRSPVTAEALAGELGVSARTIYRDLEALSGAGIPVYGMRGPGGGCGLLGGYRTSLTGLTEPEAEAMLLAGLAGPAAELGLGAALAGVQRKLLAALPDRLRGAAALARQRFHLDARGFFQAPPEHPALEALASAAWSDRRVVLGYLRADGRSVERRLDPVALVLKAGVWYLVARAGSEPRVYRVSRVARVVPTAERFARDPDFDLAAFWSKWVEEFESGLRFFPVTVRLSPRALKRQGELGDAVTRAPAEPEPVVEPDGWTRRLLAFERLDWAEAALLRFGGEVEVLEPAALRERVAEAARATASLYGPRGGRGVKARRTLRSAAPPAPAPPAAPSGSRSRARPASRGRGRRGSRG